MSAKYIISALCSICAFLLGWTGSSELRLSEFKIKQIQEEAAIAAVSVRIEEVSNRDRESDQGIRAQQRTDRESFDKRMEMVAGLVDKLLAAQAEQQQTIRDLISTVKIQYPNK